MRQCPPLTETCIACAETHELLARPVVVFRRNEGAVETRVVSVHTCDGCRVKIQRSRDARDVSTKPTPRAQRRFRSWDVAGAMSIAALGYFVAALAGWLGAWSFWAALAVVLAIPPVVVLTRRALDAREEGRAARWEQSDRALAFAEIEEALRRGLRALDTELRKEGWQTSIEVDGEVLASFDETDLVRREVWAPASGGKPRYIVRRGEGAASTRTLDP